MIILIGGNTHTGKTNLAQTILERYQYPYLSIDHLKMGLIRSGYSDMSVEDDDRITATVWPIIVEMIKTTIENRQNMVVEGCYIPYDWKNSFEEEYLEHIRSIYLVMSADYIRNCFEDIMQYASVIEDRGEDMCWTMEDLIRDNEQVLKAAKAHGCNYVLIDKKYDMDYIMDALGNIMKK